MIEALRVIAKLAITRTTRGRTLFVSVCLALVPIGAAAFLAQKEHNVDDKNFLRVVEVTLRMVATLVAVLHLAPAVADEIDGKTWTYLWSRPFPRPALVLGKVLGLAPAIMALCTVSLGIAFLIVFEGETGQHLGELARGLGSAYAATVGAAAFAIAIGALFPKHPLVFAFGWFSADQILFLVPNVAKLSPLYHVRFLAGLPGVGAEPESLFAASVWLVALTAALLLIAIWRVSRSEYARADA